MPSASTIRCSSRRSALTPIDEADVPEAGFPRTRTDGDAFAAAFDARLGRPRLAVARRVTGRRGGRRRSRARRVRPRRRRAAGRRGARSGDEPGAKNRYRLDMLNVSYHSPLMRALHHASYVFEKRLSHTADSQDQRHRMVPASRPLMTFADTRRPTYITPRLIAANPAAKAVTSARWRARGRRRTGCWSSACRSSSRSTCCRTPRRCASSSRDRSSRCCTSGRCARASTRRRRSTSRRWTRSSRCAPSTRA